MKLSGYRVTWEDVRWFTWLIRERIVPGLIHDWFNHE